MIDMYNDKDYEILSSICATEDVPDFVKQAEVETIGPPELPDGAFAVETDRRYPIHNKASAWLSSRYFEKTGHEIPVPARSIAKGKIKEACEMFGVDWPDKAGTVKKAEAPELPEAAYALATEHEGSRVLMYPVNTKEGTERSIVKFALEYKQLLPDWRRAAAINIVKKAGEYGIPVQKYEAVSKYASQNRCDETIRCALDARSRMVGDEYSKDYKILLEKSAQAGPEEIVGVINILDRRSGAAQHWDTILPDPYLSVYKDAEEAVQQPDFKVEDVKMPVLPEDEAKKASEDTIVLANRDIALSKLQAIPLDWYADVLGDDISDEISDGDDVDVEKLRLILPSLPRPDQVLLVSNLPF